MAYAEEIRQCNSIDDIIDYCHNALPSEYQGRPWTHQELSHGMNLLASDVALNCYMSAYGDMHVTKCRAAMMNFPFNDFHGSIEIVDWGCGQGIGSATIIEVLKQRNLLQWLRKVTLIEPSPYAIERAKINVCTLTHNSVEIDDKNLFLPLDDVIEEKTLNNIGYRYNNVIHVFSNILDVTTIDLGAVARMVASAHGRHFVLCIGPQNSAAYRIEKFCSVFGEQNYFSQIDSVRYARTKRNAHPYTCKTRCFEYNGATIDLNRLALVEENSDPIYNDYDLQLQIQNRVLSTKKARVARRLQSILSVDDIMYIDAVVNEVVVDFIIVRPNKGILLLNVFEDNLNEYKLSEDKKFIINEQDQQYQSPIDLISLCQSSIKDGIEELLMSTIENSRNFSLIKKAVVFTENSISEVKDFFESKGNVVNFTFLFGEEFIENRDISHNLYVTISLLYNNIAFDDIVKSKLAKIISPSWHSYQEGRIDMQPIGVQRNLSNSSNTQQKISGVAGSGKTQVLAFRAINAMKRTGGDVLILTYNITLVNYLKYRLSEIREDFSWEKIDIYHYHQFFRIRAAECHKHVDFYSYENETFFDSSKKYKKYSAIFIDEVQDYTTEWLRIIKNFLLEPNGEFVVFGDPKQNVYKRETDKNGDIRLGVIGGEWNKQLNKSRRFTNRRLADLATAFQRHFLTDLPVDNIETDNAIQNTFNFQILNYIDLRQNNSIDAIVTKIINIISNDINETRDFVVLASSTKLLREIDLLYRQKTDEKTETTFVSNEVLERLKHLHNVSDGNAANWKFDRDFQALDRTRKQLFTTGKHCLKMSTIQSFKGWESSSVIVILENKFALQNINNHPLSPQTIYTAITRARENIYIINVGNNTYHNFFYNQTL